MLQIEISGGDCYEKKIFTILMLWWLLYCFNAVYAETTVVVAQNADAKSMDPTASNDVPSHRYILIFMMLW